MFKFQFSNNAMLKMIGDSYTAKTLKLRLASLGMSVPALSSSFYLGSEPVEYILAASLACAQIGD
jgi:hypothetical protein